MNSLNYETSQNLTRMNINKMFVLSMSVLLSFIQVLFLEYVQSHSLQCFEYLYQLNFFIKIVTHSS